MVSFPMVCTAQLFWVPKKRTSPNMGVSEMKEGPYPGSFLWFPLKTIRKEQEFLIQCQSQVNVFLRQNTRLFNILIVRICIDTGGCMFLVVFLFSPLFFWVDPGLLGLGKLGKPPRIVV